MDDHIFYQGKEETRSVAPVQFFEAASGPPLAGAQATPRPLDRPRELPPSGCPSAAFQLFEDDEPSGGEGTKATPRSAGRERTVTDLSPPPG